jgi:DNA topoisomerase-2
MAEPRRTKIEEMTLREQILARPDTYVGRMSMHRSPLWTCARGRTPMLQRESVLYSHGLYQLFCEVLSNCTDNQVRSAQHGRPLTYIAVRLDTETGVVTMRNDGVTISVEPYDGKDAVIEDAAAPGGTRRVYVPEVAFGRTLSSSNYDDTEMRMTAGRNGIGVKVVNIMSTMFRVRAQDPEAHLAYDQTWTDNMLRTAAPTVGPWDGPPADAFTEVSYAADLARFKASDGTTGATAAALYTPTMLSILHAVLLQCAVINRVAVTWNGEDVRTWLGPEDPAAVPADRLCELFLGHLRRPPSAKTEEAAAAMLAVDGEGEVEAPADGEEEVEAPVDDAEEVEVPAADAEAPADTVDDGAAEAPAIPAPPEPLNVLRLAVPIGPNGETCTVWLMDSLSGVRFEHMSFVNGLPTPEGGVHVTTPVKAIARALAPMVNSALRIGASGGKGVELSYRMHDVMQNLFVMVDARLCRPEFTSQNKTFMHTPEPPAFLPAGLSAEVLAPVLRWAPLIERLRANLEVRELLLMHRITTGATGATRRLNTVDGLDHALKAGTAEGRHSTLMLAEGKSAATYVQRGMDKGYNGRRGRNYIGVYALRGKILNVRGKPLTTVTGNAILTNIVQAINIRPGVDYRDADVFHTLNYGCVMLAMDSDVDGNHIKAQIICLIATINPTLLQRADPFLWSMETPQVCVSRRNGTPIVWYMRESAFAASEYAAGAGSGAAHRGFTIRYYKGLGTHKAAQIKETFAECLVAYTWDDEADANLDKVFHRNHADARKAWLTSPPVMTPADEEMRITDELQLGQRRVASISHFINFELITFSQSDCARSLPHAVDGLKVSHRKILHTVRTLPWAGGREMKVDALSSETANRTAYHHGEVSICGGIICMAQTYIGTNNMPMLARGGEFGTRSQGGKDAAAARYITTSPERTFPLMFRPEDDGVLTRRMEDGIAVEPAFFVPVLPFILVNGCTIGIATGWSSRIPPHSPRVLGEMVHAWLDGGRDALTEPLPHYRNFLGTIERIEPGRYLTRGRMRPYPGSKTGAIIIDEIPHDTWITDYNEFLKKLVAEKVIAHAHNASTPDRPMFVVWPRARNDILTESLMELSGIVNTRNMVALFGDSYIPRVYGSVVDIFCEYAEVRLAYYVKAKIDSLASMATGHVIASAKYRFLTAIMAGTLVLSRRARADVVVDLVAAGFPTDPRGPGPEDFRYLLTMPFDSCTAEQIETFRKNRDSIAAAITELQNTAEADLWRQDVAKLLAAYDTWDRTEQLQDVDGPVLAADVREVESTIITARRRLARASGEGGGAVAAPSAAARKKTDAAKKRMATVAAAVRKAKKATEAPTATAGPTTKAGKAMVKQQAAKAAAKAKAKPKKPAAKKGQ